MLLYCEAGIVTLDRGTGATKPGRCAASKHQRNLSCQSLSGSLYHKIQEDPEKSGLVLRTSGGQKKDSNGARSDHGPSY